MSYCSDNGYICGEEEGTCFNLTCGVDCSQGEGYYYEDACGICVQVGTGCTSCDYLSYCNGTCYDGTACSEDFYGCIYDYGCGCNSLTPDTCGTCGNPADFITDINGSYCELSNIDTCGVCCGGCTTDCCSAGLGCGSNFDGCGNCSFLGNSVNPATDYFGNSCCSSDIIIDTLGNNLCSAFGPYCTDPTACNENSLGCLYEVCGGCTDHYPQNCTVDLLTDLIAYWSLDNSSWSDSSGNGNTLVATNGSVGVTTGLLGNALQITTDNNGWLQNDSISVSGDWTISSWFNVQDDAQTVEFPSLWRTATISGAEVVDVLGDHASTSGWIYDAASVANYGQFQITAKNQWIHSVVVNNEYGLFWFLNNVLVARGTATPRDWVGFALGSQGFGSFAGVTNVNVDETAIWNKGLNQKEITKLYNDRKGLAYPFVGPSIQPSVLVSYKIGALPIPQNPNNPNIKNVLLAQNTNFPLIIQAR